MDKKLVVVVDGEVVSHDGLGLELAKLKLEAMHNDLRQLQRDIFTHPDITVTTIGLLENILYDHGDLKDA